METSLKIANSVFSESETGRLANSIDWSRHTLGPVDQWPQSLKIAVSLMSNSQFPMFISWGEKRIFLYNDAYTPILGKKHPNAFGSEFNQVWSEIWADLGPLVASVDAGKASYFENFKLVMTRNGFVEETYFTFSYSPIRDESGRVGGLHCACVETTGQVVAERKVKEGEDYLKFALSSANMGTWSVTLSTNKVVLSDEAHSIFGFAQDYNSTDKAIEDFIHPEDRARVKRVLGLAIESGNAYSDEYRILRPDGEVRWILSKGSAQYSTDGKPLTLVGLLLDVTARVSSQKKIAENEDRLKFALTCANMGWWSINLLTGTAELSDIFLEIFSIPALSSQVSDIIERSIHPDDRESAAKKLKDAVDRNAPYRDEYRIIRSDGSIRWVLTEGRTRHEEAGKPVNLSGVVTDITNRKEAEESILLAKKAAEIAMIDAVAARAEAERANSLKSAFLANMSHEIRTPLGVMIGFSDLITDPELSNDEKKQYAKTLKRNGEQLVLLINDILDLSKVEAGHLQVEIIEFSLRSLIEEVLSAMNVKTAEKGLKLSLKIGASVTDRVTSDPLRLRQILFNMLSNAIKFTSRGEVTLSVTHKDGTVAIEVQDTGIGIAKEHQAALFKPFHQADESITRKFGGTGLGLALSKKLAELLGGALSLKESTPEKGSTFELKIKNHSPNAERANVREKKNDQALIDLNQNLEGVSVLLVEDSPDNQHLISRVLTKQGATVDLADDGQIGVKKALKGHYDIILMDVQMPVLDGYSATQLLREAGYRKPIIALTAHAMSEIRKKCLDVGCTDHLPKPVNFGDLISTVAKYTQTTME